MKKFIFLAIFIISSGFSLCPAEVQYSITDLGTLGGSMSRAYSINDSGQVVGISYFDEGLKRHAFLYDESMGMVDLNNLIPSDSGWLLSRAFGINSSGHIIGSGSINGEKHAFLLIPEPTTLLLLSLGGFVLRKRK